MTLERKHADISAYDFHKRCQKKHMVNNLQLWRTHYRHRILDHMVRSRPRCWSSWCRPRKSLPLTTASLPKSCFIYGIEKSCLFMHAILIRKACELAFSFGGGSSLESKQTIEQFINENDRRPSVCHRTSLYRNLVDMLWSKWQDRYKTVMVMDLKQRRAMPNVGTVSIGGQSLLESTLHSRSTLFRMHRQSLYLKQKSLQCWRAVLQRCRENHAQADVTHRLFLVRSAFRHMTSKMERYRQLESLMKLDSPRGVVTQNCLRLHFRVWFMRTRYYRRMALVGIALRRYFAARTILRKVSLSIKRKEEKLERFQKDQTRKAVQTRLGQWRHAVDLHSRLRFLRLKRTRLRWDVWRSKLSRLVAACKEIQDQRRQRYLTRFIDAWKTRFGERVRLFDKAAHHQEHSLVNSTWNTWRNRHRHWSDQLEVAKSHHASKMLLPAIRRWRMARVRHHQVDTMMLQLLQWKRKTALFATWRQKYCTSIGMNARAEAFAVMSKLQHSIQQWRRQIVFRYMYHRFWKLQQKLRKKRFWKGNPRAQSHRLIPAAWRYQTSQKRMWRARLYQYRLNRAMIVPNVQRHYVR